MLDKELYFISNISKKLGTLIKVPIIDNKKHGNCFNNCLASGKEIINGYYILMNKKMGVYEFIRHSIIKENDKYFDITDPGLSVSFIYFIVTDSKFYDLPIKMFYNDGFVSDYSLLQKGEYYIYGLFAPNKKVPFYIGKGKGNRAKYHLREKSLNEDTNSHKCRTIRKIGVDNVIIKRKYSHLLSEEFAYDLEESTILYFGLENLTNICLQATPQIIKAKHMKKYMA